MKFVKKSFKSKKHLGTLKMDFKSCFLIILFFTFLKDPLSNRFFLKCTYSYHSEELEKSAQKLKKLKTVKTSKKTQRLEALKASKSREIKSTGEDVQKDVKHSIHGVHFVESKGEEKLWELWSDEIQGLRDGKNWFLNKVKVDFFTEKMTLFTVKGKKGFIENLESEKKIVIEGNVKIVSTNKLKLKTKKVEYRSKLHTLESSHFVQIRGLERKDTFFFIKAQKMKVFLKEGIINLEGKINGYYGFFHKPSQKIKKIYVKSESLSLNDRSMSLNFSKNVIIDIEQAQIKAPKAIFQYEKKRGKFTNVKILNGIEMKDKDKTATAETLEFNLLENTYVFKGRSRLVSGKDEIRGDKMTMTDGGKKVKIEKAFIKTNLKRRKL